MSESIYKQKVCEQMNRMETLQEKCEICDVSAFLELARNILSLAKIIDESEQVRKRGKND